MIYIKNIDIKDEWEMQDILEEKAYKNYKILSCYISLDEIKPIVENYEWDKNSLNRLFLDYVPVLFSEFFQDNYYNS